nr:hypothetical protein CFP56_19493 [Quercus suber]
MDSGERVPRRFSLRGEKPHISWESFLFGVSSGTGVFGGGGRRDVSVHLAMGRYFSLLSFLFAESGECVYRCQYHVNASPGAGHPGSLFFRSFFSHVASFGRHVRKLPFVGRVALLSLDAFFATPPPASAYLRSCKLNHAKPVSVCNASKL